MEKEKEKAEEEAEENQEEKVARSGKDVGSTNGPTCNEGLPKEEKER